MASKLALRTLGAIALPGAFLAMAAPAASAAELPEVAPLSGTQQSSTMGTDEGSDQGEASALPDSSELLSGESFDY